MVKRSRKYEGLLWRKTLKVIKACLYKTRCLINERYIVLTIILLYLARREGAIRVAFVRPSVCPSICLSVRPLRT